MLDKFDNLDSLDEYLKNSGDSSFMEFNNESIDFEKVGSKFRKKHGPPHRFGLTKFQKLKLSISEILIFRYDCEKVFMKAKSIIIDNRIKKDSFAIIGLKQYLIKEIKNIRCKWYLFGIPIFSYRYFFNDHFKSKLIPLVADSLILTILNKPHSTNDGPSGLNHVCRWIDEELPIDPSKNEYIEIINQELLD